ncbi:hypothetical protein QR680_012789 [Steinernema hermaphroditum]|uniref:Uncharacterized protein n=1 Tax=Steinernema hermaphroditum TaxID=289476 RepID=A0AA39I382_9BILA|nr:hypothetical protein QR680_012789 [Steinernema hermaphroditum]
MFSRKKEKDKEKSNEGVQNDSKASYTSMQVNIFYVFLLNELIFLCGYCQSFLVSGNDSNLIPEFCFFIRTII